MRARQVPISEWLTLKSEFADLQRRLEAAEERAAALERERDEYRRERGFCEICWTIAWEPVESRQDCDGCKAGLMHDSEMHTRCLTCWQRSALAAANARVEAAKRDLEISRAARRAIEEATKHYYDCAMEFGNDAPAACGEYLDALIRLTTDDALSTQEPDSKQG